MRDIFEEPLTAIELDLIIGTRDPVEFVRTKEKLYQGLGWDTNPPSRQQALRTMAKHPELIVRPIVVKGRSLVVGFSEDALRALT